MDMAAAYDRQFARIDILKDALLLLAQIALSELPENARILCVGAGTGAEILHLAGVFPKWHFTAVDPAKHMLDMCRVKVGEQGFADRCCFHEGYLYTLENAEPYHAATSILVSQFLLDPEKRQELFREIASRLLPRGILVNADLASRLNGIDHAALMEIWVRTLRYTGMNPDPAVYGRDVAVSPPP